MTLTGFEKYCRQYGNANRPLPVFEVGFAHALRGFWEFGRRCKCFGEMGIVSNRLSAALGSRCVGHPLLGPNGHLTIGAIIVRNESVSGRRLGNSFKTTAFPFSLKLSRTWSDLMVIHNALARRMGRAGSCRTRLLCLSPEG
jgi:hypothetical protein